MLRVSSLSGQAWSIRVRIGMAAVIQRLDGSNSYAAGQFRRPQSVRIC